MRPGPHLLRSHVAWHHGVRDGIQKIVAVDIMGSETSTDLPAQLTEAFTEMGPAWGRWVHGCLPDDAVSYARLRVLTALQCENDLTMTQLATALEVTPRRITALVDALEADGLAERYRHPTDGRSVIVVITEDGLKQQKISWESHQTEVSTAFADLPADDQASLLRISRELTEIFRSRLTLRNSPPPPARGPRILPGDRNRGEIC